MTTQVQEKQQERLKIREDLIAGKVPKRVYMWGAITLEACCHYAGIDLRKAHYSMDLMEKAYDAVCKDFYFDAMPIENVRYAGPYQILGAQNWILASNGAIQHPEIETMYAEDYDEFNAEPYGTMVEKFLPRVCTNLQGNATSQSLTFAKAIDSYDWYVGGQNAIFGRLTEKYGYAPGFITNAPAEAPFDFLADQLRGFKQINMDVRRIPDKVKGAVEAITPLMIKRALHMHARPGAYSFMPLHLAPYISMKTFESLYWPTMEEVIVECDKAGVGFYLFCEQDWTRYHEFLSKLPESTQCRFEDGDPKLLKETVGKNHVISGFFDPTITLTKSKDECLDEIKRLVDTCAPGGRYYFHFDKNLMDFKAVDVKKLQAVLDWVHLNTNY